MSNILLTLLQAQGLMTKGCLAFHVQSQASGFIERNPERSLFHMGDDTKPGPFWAVYPEDVAALEGAGYKLLHRGSAPDASDTPVSG